MRSTEQALIGEFTDALAVVYRSLSADSLDAAVAIAALPDAVRGYEDLKLRRVADFREQLAEHLARYP
jgi:indolepyruvate ferredoxin oxidoreductase